MSEKDAVTICDNCDFAKWKLTANGRLHPDKSGRCVAQIPPFVVPAAFYWIGSRSAPTPIGGYLERGKSIPRPCSYKRVLGERQ